MPSLLFCGPKMAACGIVISIWGVIMLVRARIALAGATTSWKEIGLSRWMSVGVVKMVLLPTLTVFQSA